MRSTAAVLGFIAFVFSSSAFAVGRLAEVTVYDRGSGRVLPVYSAGGEQYVAGRPGNEYEVRVRNNTNEEILAVISVDGVNVVTGETAAPSQSGYVIGPWRSLSIAGWRKSLARIATFYFTDHSDAYATRTGRPDDVGVIGVAVFKRKFVPPVELEAPRLQQRYREDKRGKLESSTADNAGARAAAPPAPAAEPQAQEKSLGTGHGRSEGAEARYVQFERESDLPNEVITIRYDTRANLVARGIIVEPVREPRREPNPFPARFVADPPARW
jgi:hypothetical protein